MSLVVDAGFVVAALADGGTDGRWAEELLSGADLAAPHLMPVEAANVLRRAALAGDISHDAAALAHADLVALRVTLFPYAPFAQRVWELARERDRLRCLVRGRGGGSGFRACHRRPAPVASVGLPMRVSDAPAVALLQLGWQQSLMMK